MQFMPVSFAGGLLLLSVGTAAAGPTKVTADLHLYTGPGSEHRFGDVMPPEP